MNAHELPIRIFIRLDQSMIELLSKGTKVVMNHSEIKYYQYWWIPAKNLTKPIQEWLAGLEKYSWVNASVGGVLYTVIGISLSTVDIADIYNLIDNMARFPIVEAAIAEGGYVNTKSPYIYSHPNDGYNLYVEKRYITTPEKKFREALRDHDFFYEYSDSLTVYRAGKARESELKKDAIASGLTPANVEKIYQEEYERRVVK